MEDFEYPNGKFYDQDDLCPKCEDGKLEEKFDEDTGCGYIRCSWCGFCPNDWELPKKGWQRMKIKIIIISIIILVLISFNFYNSSEREKTITTYDFDKYHEDHNKCKTEFEKSVKDIPLVGDVNSIEFEIDQLKYELAWSKLYDCQDRISLSNHKKTEVRNG